MKISRSTKNKMAARRWTRVATAGRAPLKLGWLPPRAAIRPRENSSHWSIQSLLSK